MLNLKMVMVFMLKFFMRFFPPALAKFVNDLIDQIALFIGQLVPPLQVDRLHHILL
jgi:hypothetical protein